MTSRPNAIDDILNLLEIDSEMSADDFGTYFIVGKSEFKTALLEAIKAVKPDSKLNPSIFKEGYDEGTQQYEQNLINLFEGKQ